MRSLTVLYDETCGFCVRCAEWISRQPTYLPVRTLPAGSPEAAQRFPGAKGKGPLELVAVDNHGGVYRDADALLITLWSLRDYREWSLRLSSPSLKPWARAVFWRLSKGRHGLSRFFRWEGKTMREAAKEPMPTCNDGHCRVHPRTCPECQLAIGDATVCPRCLIRVVLAPKYRHDG